MRTAVMTMLVMAIGAINSQGVAAVPPKVTLIEPETKLWQAIPALDGTVVAVTGDERTLRVWDPATKKAQTWEQGATDAGSILFTADGKALLVGRRDGTVSSHNPATGQELARTKVAKEGKDRGNYFPLVPDTYGAPAFDLSPDGTRFALDNPNAMPITLTRWPGGDLPVRLRNEPRNGEAYTSSVRFGTGGKRLYCLCAGDARGFVAIWDVADEKLLRVLVPPRSVSQFCVSPDGRWIGVGGPFNPLVTVWDAESSFKPTHLPIPGGCCKGIAFSHDGKLAATVSTESMGHKRARAVVWELSTGRQVRSWTVTDGFWVGWIVFFAHDGQTLFTGGRVEGLQAWDLSAPLKE